MPERNDPSQFAAIHKEAADIWDGNAAFCDDYMEEGSDCHLELICPAQERLPEIEKGERILEIAYGNGSFAMRQALPGATVVTTD